MISPKLSQQILGLNLTSIRRINDYLSSCIIKDQIEEEERFGQFRGVCKVVEMDESCFYKRKITKEESKSKYGCLAL